MSRKFVQWQQLLYIQVDGWIDMMKLTCGFFDYTNTPENMSAETLHEFSTSYTVRYNYQFSFAVRHT
jgi:hypothetical protein